MASKKFNVEVQATVRKAFRIEASNPEEAKSKFLEMLNSGKFDATKRMFGPDKAFDNIIILRTTESNADTAIASS